MRILIINIFGIGDVLFTTPLIKNIKANIPDAFIGYIANQRAAAVLEDNPNIDKVIVYERDEYRDVCRESKIGFLRKIKGTLQAIKEDHYDLVIDLSLNSYASFFMWLIGIPKRLGFNYKNRSPFLTKKVPLEGYEGRPVAEYYLSLLKELNLQVHTRQLELVIKREDRQWAEDFLVQHGLLRDSVIGIVPGGGASWGKDAVYKRWPQEKYAKLADKIIENFSTRIILLGDKTEEDLCKGIEDLMKQKTVQACGKTSLGQCAALMERCTLVIVNDGGPLHIAVASGVKTVSLFGPVDEDVYGPYPRDDHRIVTKTIACRPCYRQFRRASCDHISCLNQIEIEDVFNRVEECL